MFARLPLPGHGFQCRLLVLTPPRCASRFPSRVSGGWVTCLGSEVTSPTGQAGRTSLKWCGDHGLSLEQGRTEGPGLHLWEDMCVACGCRHTHGSEVTHGQTGKMTRFPTSRALHDAVFPDSETVSQPKTTLPTPCLVHSGEQWGAFVTCLANRTMRSQSLWPPSGPPRE